MKLRVEHTLNAKDYMALRDTTNWSSFDKSVVEQALRNDLFAVCIYFNDEAVGMGRVIGDGEIYFYVQDVIVHPEHQGLGIGKMIMEEIESFFEKNANVDSFVGLMAAEGVEKFYQNFGFERRENNRPGMFKIAK